MNNNQIYRYFNIARCVSKLSDFNGNRRVKIGAILVYKNQIISSGFNTCKTSPKMKRLNKYRGFDPEDGLPKLHAEASAILHCRNDINWSKANIFVYREYKNGKPAPAYPCNGCMKLIKEKGIKNIYYTDVNSYNHKEILY